MLVVLVERHAPGDLLGGGVDLHLSDRREDLASDDPDGSVGAERDPRPAAGAVFDDGLVSSAAPKDREIEAAKRRARSAQRFAA